MKKRIVKCSVIFYTGAYKSVIWRPFSSPVFATTGDLLDKVVDIIKKHNIVVLEAFTEHIDTMRKKRRTVHAVGDGTFIGDGRKIDRKSMMASKLPDGV